MGGGGSMTSLGSCRATQAVGEGGQTGLKQGVATGLGATGPAQTPGWLWRLGVLTSVG